jgi:hypothetical protein
MQLRGLNGYPLDEEYEPHVTIYGQATGYLTGTHPLPVVKVLDKNDLDLWDVMHYSLPEGGYRFNALACHYLPKIGQHLPGEGRGGQYDLKVVNMDWTPYAGPVPTQVVAQTNPLATAGRSAQTGDTVGPFLSFRGLTGLDPNSLRFVNHFDVFFDPTSVQVNDLVVTLNAGGQPIISPVPVVTEQTPNAQWSIELDMSQLPAGPVNMRIQAYGKYMGSGPCSQAEDWGEPYDLTLAMVPAPPWLGQPWTQDIQATYDGNQHKYVMTGAIHGAGNQPLNLGYLGPFNNSLSADITLKEEFYVQTGIWKVVGHTGKANATLLDVNLLPGGKTFVLMATPMGNSQASAFATPYPSAYSWPSTELANATYGPVQVYNGIIASFWGVVNVRLSISFGANLFVNGAGSLAADLDPNITVTPGAQMTGSIKLWVDILLGVASAGVEGAPGFQLTGPLHIGPGTTVAFNTQACFWMTGRVWASALFWEKSFGPYNLFSFGQGCPFAARTLAPADTPLPSVLAAPSVASDGEGHVMVTWVHNNSNLPEQQNQGVLYYVYWNGVYWSDPAIAVGNASYLVTDPAVAFVARKQAVAVFAINTPNPQQPGTWDDLRGQLAGQQIAYSRFNGLAWSPPVNLTNFDGPSGRVALAADIERRLAMAMWIHDTGSQEYEGWQVEYAVYQANADPTLAGNWTAPALVQAPPANSLEAEVALSFKSTGDAMAIWVRQGDVNVGGGADPDSPFNKNNQRHLVVGTWNHITDAWTITTPSALPTGILMPDIAFDSADRPVLAYAVYGTDGDGVTPTGLGNNNVLGFAMQNQGAWLAGIKEEVRGIERPRIVMLSENQAGIVYRGFGRAGTQSYEGLPLEVMVSLDPSAFQASDPLPATGGGGGWMFHTAVSHAPKHGGGQSYKIPGGQIVAGVYNLLGHPTTGQIAGASLHQLGMEDDSLTAVNIPILADLSIAEEDFIVPETLPLPGTPLTLKITVRNTGLGSSRQAAELSLTLDPGTAGEQLIASDTITAGLGFNESYELIVTWPAVGGLHQLEARVSPSLDDDADGTNNAVWITLGAPSPPQGLVAAPDGSGQAVYLAWLPAEGAAISGYRIYRAKEGGALYWLGDSAETIFVDGHVEPGATYHYAVAAKSLAGIESVPCEQVSVTILAVYLPLVCRNS